MLKIKHNHLSLGLTSKYKAFFLMLSVASILYTLLRWTGQFYLGNALNI